MENFKFYEIDGHADKKERVFGELPPEVRNFWHDNSHKKDFRSCRVGRWGWEHVGQTQLNEFQAAALVDDFRNSVRVEWDCKKKSGWKIKYDKIGLIQKYREMMGAGLLDGKLAIEEMFGV